MSEHKRIIIDPPEGWKYGFPRVYDNPDNKPIEVWLVDNGYPHSLILEGGHEFCRYWEEDVSV